MASQTNSALRHPLIFRILHEIIIVSIILLTVTGFYIHRPFVGGAGFLMTLARGVHFFFAAVLVIAFVARLVTMFAGKNRDWRSFIPTWSDIKLIPKTMGYYLYMCKDPGETKKYRPTQMISYCGIFLLIIFQVISGLAIKYVSAFGWWNYGLFNNEIEVRIAHFVVTWLLVLFVMLHFYLAIREAFGEIKQMHLLSGGGESEGAAKEPGR